MLTGLYGIVKATKILFVDDDSTTRAFPVLFLRKWGYEVIEAADGEQALAILDREPISLVITDWVMPNLSGVELCRRIREKGSTHYTYLILCTSKGEKADLIVGMEAGADDFMVKPISKDELRVKVRAGERVLALEQGLADRNRELSAANTQLQTAYARMETDLQAAAWMQSNLLPLASTRTLNIVSEWRLRPSSYVAGDIFNIFPVDDHQVGFYLLDVSGHGVPAAMLSVTLSMLLRPDSAHGTPLKRFNTGLLGFEVVPPAEVVNDLNQRFQSKDDQYFTLIYGLLDSCTGELMLTQAGHPHPILIGQDRELMILGNGGPPVGILPDMEYENTCQLMHPGDRLLLYSDGITECQNQEGTQFGEDRLHTYLKAQGNQPLPEMLDGLEAEMEAWRGSSNFDDDVSVLVLEFR